MFYIKSFLSFLIVGFVLILVIPIQPTDFMHKITQPVTEKVDQLVEGKSFDTALKTPKQQQFAIYNIQMNMSQKEVEAALGPHSNVLDNEYGTKWYVYHNDFNHFVLVSYIDGKVHGLFSNQNTITSKSGIKYNTPKDVVRHRLGKPLEGIQKGNTLYRQNNEAYDVFEKDNIYTTAFYDIHRKNHLTALLQVSKTMENRLNGQYAAPSKNLANSYEKLDYYLVNATRVQNGLEPLNYSESLANTARKHSKDMAMQQYFEHTNLKGESPFDRIKKDGHHYSTAAENLAYGQQSPIFAHQGLMNSAGHRKNILHPNVTTLGVGVDFNAKKQPYWTENYTG
ncbi:CAP-associated domain-containing protein [Staphylococcus ratti]|uniref:CAP domain-containing protein n=1 Tax=Staphylococcus ratti TaxID=2892440 RepID=A0ABY3PAE0_9STAP|nr:CAP domain-containing protein [Staphylococcus ratti]UEX89246.1 CAP domain-containing protein [Staphylococcus ratti]